MADQTVLPVATQLLSCLTDALATNPNPPMNYSFRTGDNVWPDFNANQDECCEGLAYVRVARIYPSGGENTFPAADELFRPCSPLAWGVTFEMGVWRCEPQPTATELVSTAQWTATATQVSNDWEAMTRAACCLRDALDLADPGTPVYMGEWAPLNAGGGCVGGMMNVSVQVMACTC